MKRLIFCFDGSWNRLDSPHPTNVLLTAESVLPVDAGGMPQVTFYDEGVGTDEGEAISGGVFGAGLVKNLSDAYRFLIFNYSPGDEIYVFGFSRGAYTARSFAGLLNSCGVLQRQQAQRANEAIDLYKRRSKTEAFETSAYEFRRDCSPNVCISQQEDAWRSINVPGYIEGSAALLKIKYLGVWDTVGALGIPGYIVLANRINRMHQFHDVSLSPLVEQARHAVAIDEHRVDFEPALWENLGELNLARGAEPHSVQAPYQQRWFPGTHGSVGGGGERRGLSDIALDWIWDGARQAGLELDASSESYLSKLAPDYREHLANRVNQPGFNAVDFLLDRLPRGDRWPGPADLHELSPAAQRRWKEADKLLPEGQGYRPETLTALAAELDELVDDPVGNTEVATIHIVQPGETLREIARRMCGTDAAVNRILAANLHKLCNEEDIHPGQALRIPKFP